LGNEGDAYLSTQIRKNEPTPADEPFWSNYLNIKKDPSEEKK